MNQSRLSSWPTYGWYSHGSGPPSYGVPLYLRYQATTVSSPSGFIDGTISTTTESSRRVSPGSVASWEASVRPIRLEAISVEWMFFPTTTTAGCMAPQVFYAPQVNPRGAASGQQA